MAAFKGLEDLHDLDWRDSEEQPAHEGKPS